MPTTGHKARAAPGGKQVTWSVPESLETDALLADVTKTFKIRPEKGLAKTREWFDTDDWRLYRKNLLLYYESGHWNLVQRNSGKPVSSFSSKRSRGFRFSWDFPVSRMRSLLEPVISIRALLPLLTQNSTTLCYRFLNKDRKTIALLYFDDHTTFETLAEYRSVTLQAVRGYDSSFNDVKGFLENYGIRDKASFSEPLDQGVLSLGRLPEDYASKFSIELKKDLPARQAMKCIYRQLLETMEHNIYGIVKDLDTEFLHDFRVAIRRTRSGLGQVKGVLPPDVVTRAREDFSWLGSVTGPTRDLDVYLLERDQYMSRLPRNLRPCLDYFFVDIARQREEEQKKLVTHLHSKKFRQVLESWQVFLENGNTYGETGKSGLPVKTVARQIIFRKYTKILKDGGAIKRSSPDEDLHRLRIQCKKLRYILEFFSSLFPPAKMILAIKQLKRLQDNLGTFNDLSVQQEMLQKYLAALRPGSKKNQQLATAIGGLLTNLHHEQQRVRKRFYSRFHQFSCEENQQLYTKLFN